MEEKQPVRVLEITERTAIGEPITHGAGGVAYRTEHNGVLRRLNPKARGKRARRLEREARRSHR